MAGLDEGDIDPDPFVQLARWFDDALAAEPLEPNAMTLATVGADGRPTARTVLLKGVDSRGFLFFTNYASRKARQLEGNPNVALVFLWRHLQRQVSVTGAVERLTAGESDAYFATRPRGSRLGAIASPQSTVIESREVLDRRLAEVEATYEGVADPPRPAHWGGYRVVPDSIELWQGRPDRLHDRLVYRRGRDAWEVVRLAP